MARILVVDDDFGARQLFRAVLRYAGHRVAVARSGETALRRCRREPFDVAVVDLLMPGIDGLELIGTLRRTMPAIQIVAVSAGATVGGRDLVVDLLEAARDFGAVVALRKPVAPSDLIRGVETASTREPPAAPARPRRRRGAG
jgi:CheY-like chemotaxis protein